MQSCKECVTMGIKALCPQLAIVIFHYANSF